MTRDPVTPELRDPKPTPKPKVRKPLKSKPHGISPNLREQVMERDGYVCQWCRVAGGRLDPHHILPRGRGGTDILLNLVAVHRICHDYIHQHPWEARPLGFLA